MQGHLVPVVLHLTYLFILIILCCVMLYSILIVTAFALYIYLALLWYVRGSIKYKCVYIPLIQI